MKKKLFLMFIAILAVVQMQAQNQPKTHGCEHKNKMEMHHRGDNCKDVSLLKKQYMKDSLQLAPNEESNFWSIYDKTEEKEQKVHEDFLNFKKEQLVMLENGRVDYKALTEVQKLLLLEKRIEMKTKLAFIEQDFFNEMKNAIQPQSVLQYYKLEKEFRKKVVRESKMKGFSPTKEEGSEPLPKKIKR